MSLKKEKREHPWASTATAKRIASDHAKKSKHKVVHQTGEMYPNLTARKDFVALYGKAHNIAYQRKP
jgi:hypothetical protein